MWCCGIFGRITRVSVLVGGGGGKTNRTFRSFVCVNSTPVYRSVYL